jgi:hypothetical protein
VYSDEDINAAVAAGTLTPEAAAGLRAQVSADREMPVGDEENFRLVTSFNDIFVTIGVIILLVAVGSIGGTAFSAIGVESLGFALASVIVAATAWLLAEIFTRKRRMALPSIVLLTVFVWSVFFAAAGLVITAFTLGADAGARTGGGFDSNIIVRTLGAAVAIGWMMATGAITVFATYLHWKRFMVPITVAAGAAALVGSMIAALMLATQAVNDGHGSYAALPLVFISGIGVFIAAMRWDMSDRERTTRRSDVAFWLHLLAAPMIAHPLFYSLGVVGGSKEIGVGAALGVVAIYVLFGLVALAIDRRALLVSALAYVLGALAVLFRQFGAVELNFAFTALIIGSALLTLSVFWSPIRARLVAKLPAELRSRLPVVGTVPAV